MKGEEAPIIGGRIGGVKGLEKKKNRANAVCVNSVGKASILWEEKIGL
jgi:hypothetical protein